MTAIDARILATTAEHKLFRVELRAIRKAASKGERHVDLPRSSVPLRLTMFLRGLGYTVEPFFKPFVMRVSW